MYSRKRCTQHSWLDCTCGLVVVSSEYWIPTLSLDPTAGDWCGPVCTYVCTINQPAASYAMLRTHWYAIIFRTYTSSNFHPGGPFYKDGYIFLSITAHHTETGDLYLYICWCAPTWDLWIWSITAQNHWKSKMCGWFEDTHNPFQCKGKISWRAVRCCTTFHITLRFTVVLYTVHGKVHSLRQATLCFIPTGMLL